MSIDFMPIVAPSVPLATTPVASKPNDVAKPLFIQVYEDAGRPKQASTHAPEGQTETLPNGDTKSKHEKLLEMIDDQRKLIGHLKDKLDKMKQQLAAARAQLKHADGEEAQRLMGVIQSLSDAITRLQQEIIQVQAGIDANSMAERALENPEFMSEKEKKDESA